MINTNFIRWNNIVNPYYPKLEKNFLAELTQEVLTRLSYAGLKGVEPYWQQVMRKLSQKRYEHVLRVLELANQISVANNFDDYQQFATTQAALLHDIARELAPLEMFSLAPPQIETEKLYHLTLHGKAGCKIAKNWGIKDYRVLDAIEGHVFGPSPDNLVGIAVYVADVSEPGRSVNQDIRELALKDLNKAYQQAVISKVTYLQSKNKIVHPATLKVYYEVCNTA